MKILIEFIVENKQDQEEFLKHYKEYPGVCGGLWVDSSEGDTNGSTK